MRKKKKKGTFVDDGLAIVREKRSVFEWLVKEKKDRASEYVAWNDEQRLDIERETKKHRWNEGKRGGLRKNKRGIQARTGHWRDEINMESVSKKIIVIKVAQGHPA